MGIFSKVERLTGSLPAADTSSLSIMGPFAEKIPVIAEEVVLALLPVAVIFAIFQKTSFKLSKKAVRKIFTGLIFTFVGLVLFLTGVNGGFMEVGSLIGRKLPYLITMLILSQLDLTWVCYILRNLQLTY